jgi:hypothetical protein
MESNLKNTSFLLILIINFLVGVLFWTIFIKDGTRVFNLEFWNNGRLILLLIIFLEIFALSLLFQLKKIIIEKDKIIFKCLLFPFIKKVRQFSYYDFSKFVDEQSKTGYYESLWLFKNGKLEDQISSFYYTNYTKLKFELKVQNKGKLKINSFKQIYLKFGGKL